MSALERAQAGKRTKTAMIVRSFAQPPRLNALSDAAHQFAEKHVATGEPDEDRFKREWTAELHRMQELEDWSLLEIRCMKAYAFAACGYLWDDPGSFALWAGGNWDNLVRSSRTSTTGST